MKHYTYTLKPHNPRLDVSSVEGIKTQMHRLFYLKPLIVGFGHLDGNGFLSPSDDAAKTEVTFIRDGRKVVGRADGLSLLFYGYQKAAPHVHSLMSLLVTCYPDATTIRREQVLVDTVVGLYGRDNRKVSDAQKREVYTKGVETLRKIFPEDDAQIYRLLFQNLGGYNSTGPLWPKVGNAESCKQFLRVAFYNAGESSMTESCIQAEKFMDSMLGGQSKNKDLAHLAAAAMLYFWYQLAVNNMGGRASDAMEKDHSDRIDLGGLPLRITDVPIFDDDVLEKAKNMAFEKLARKKDRANKRGL